VALAVVAVAVVVDGVLALPRIRQVSMALAVVVV
jgi:hypothetical protein